MCSLALSRFSTLYRELTMSTIFASDTIPGPGMRCRRRSSPQQGRWWKRNSRPLKHGAFQSLPRGSTYRSQGDQAQFADINRPKEAHESLHVTMLTIQPARRQSSTTRICVPNAYLLDEVNRRAVESRD